MLKQFSAFPMAGIPLEAAASLKLTTAQREKIADTVEASRTAGRAALDDARANGDFQAIRDVMQKTREAVHDKVTAVLNRFAEQDAGGIYKQPSAARARIWPAASRRTG